MTKLAEISTNLSTVPEAQRHFEQAQAHLKDDGSFATSEQVVFVNQIADLFKDLAATDRTVDAAIAAQPALSQEALHKARLSISELISKAVQHFKKTVLNQFFKAYFPGKVIAPQGVTTLVESKFASPTAEQEAKFKEVQNLLKNANVEGDSKLDYYQWLDLENTILKNSNAAYDMRTELRKKHFTKAFVMGMGGSSQFPKMIQGIFPDGNPNDNLAETPFQMEVMDGTDSSTLNTKLNNLNFQANEVDNKTAFVIISKSGNTFEVMHVVQALLGRLTELHSGNKEEALKQFARQAVFISEPGQGALNKLAQQIKEKTGVVVKSIEHPNRVGGRFSFFSTVGMLPAALKELDLNKFYEGAKAARDEFFNAENISKSSVGQLATLGINAAKSGEFAAKLIAPYSDKLAFLGAADEQLAGESNMKNGMDALPVINSRGPLFQHSTIEALVRNDKKHNIIFEQILTKKDKDVVHGDWGLGELKPYSRKSMHQDTITTLALPLAKYLRDNQGNPVISTIMDEINEYNVGYLLMRNMLATVVQSGMQDEKPDQNIDVFKQMVPRTTKNLLLQAVDQRGVETYKVAKDDKTSDKADGISKTNLGLQNVELAA